MYAREGGDPASNGIARCARSKANCGWLRPCTLGHFLLLVQEKVTKEKDTPGWRRLVLASAALGPCAAPTRHRCRGASGADIPVSRLLRDARPKPRGARARANGVLKTTSNLRRSEVVFKSPSERAEHRSEAGSISRAPVRAEPRRVCSRPTSWRSARLGRGSAEPGSLRGPGGVLLFGAFLCTSKEKCTCRGSATHKLVTVAAGDTRNTRVQGRSHPPLAFQSCAERTQ